MIYLYFCALQNLFFASAIMDLFVGVDLPVDVCGSSLQFAKLKSCQGRVILQCYLYILLCDFSLITIFLILLPNSLQVCKKEFVCRG